jgi:hypothetical protein
MSELVLYNTIRSTDSFNFQALPRCSTCNHRLNVLMAPKSLIFILEPLNLLKKKQSSNITIHILMQIIKMSINGLKKKFNLEKAPHIKSTISRILLALVQVTDEEDPDQELAEQFNDVPSIHRD